MRMYDIILKKRKGLELTTEEINFVVKAYTKGDIPDYQMSALLMAIFFQDMTIRETTDLTLAMAGSGDMVDLSEISGIKVDKHSTGGVGDKTTLVVAPIVASLGVKVAKMSGRGLGHTGGTVDKLESIPNLETSFTMDKFFEIVNKTGIAVVGQSANLAPADKKIYALRDVTATVDKIPLIASSIISKKLASGSVAIVLDVKCGSGAFIKTVDQAIELSKIMVQIAENAGRKCVALITDMNMPLGENVGNSLEVIEAIDVLKGKGPEDLRHECVTLASEMLALANVGSVDECAKLAEKTLSNGSALEKFVEMVVSQGGNQDFIKNTDLFEKAKFVHEVKAEKSGYIYKMDTEQCGIASLVLGAGRKTLDSAIDFSAGLKIKAKTGQFVNKGDVLVELYTNDEERIKESEMIYKSAVEISEEKPEESKQILARVDKNSAVKY